MAEYSKLNKFLEDWNNSKLAGNDAHNAWLFSLRDDQRELAEELQSKSLDQLVEDNNISDYINLYKIHPTYEYRINNPNAAAMDMIMAGHRMEWEIIGGNTGLQGNFLDWADKLLFEYEFLKQNGNSESYEEAYAWAAENADPITYEEFEAVRPLIDFNSNGVSFNSVADEHNTTFRAAEESESDPIVWDGASAQDVMSITGTVSQFDRGTYEQAAESLGLSLEEFLAQYDYTGDGEIDVGDGLDILKYEQGAQTQPPGYDSDNFTALPEPEPVDSDGDGVPDENDAFPNDATETVDTDNDGVGDNAQAAAERAAAEKIASDDAATQTSYEDNSAAAAERDYDQRHALAFDIDADGKIDALTDGFLYLRYLFGLRGDQMTSGAISNEATRTTEEIQAYLEDPRVRKMLDFDRSGVMAIKDGVEINDAITDGLIGIRYGFGLSGETLTTEAAALDSEYFEDGQAFEENIKRLMQAAFVLDDDGNITDELVFNAAVLSDTGRVTGIKADAEIDDEVRYDYENLDTPIADDGQTPEPEPEPEPVDSDGDGVPDEADAFPNDPNETTDSDSDGVGDNSDVFPNDPNETTDSDSDGVGDNTDPDPNNADITNQEEFNASRAKEDEDADADSLGFGELPTKEGTDRSGYRQEFYDALRDENGTVQLFNNGITGGDIFYQGYVIPLTTEQLIDGYYSILETGQWTDPRYAIINDYNDNHNPVNQVRAPIRSGADITVEGRYADTVSNDALSGMTGNHHAARAFLDEHTTGSFSYYGQMGGPAQTVDINYGRDGNGDFITLKDLFENRVPATGNGLTRVDRENILPAGFVQGVDRVPEIDELYQFYTDALIYASARNPDIQYAYDYADNVMAGLPEELFNKWKEHTPVKRWDQDDVFLSELKKAVRPADLLGLNHYTEVDTDLLRDYAETISGSGEGGAYRKYFNTVADAIDKFVDDPGSLTAEEKEYLNQYRVAQTDLYLSTDPLDEDDFEVEGTALSDVSRLADYQNAQNFWLDRETKYGDNQGIRDAIEENYDYQFGAWEPDPENPYDKPPEYGLSMISQANGGLQFSNGEAYYGGTNVAVDDVVVWDEDGKGYGRIEWGAYVNSWQQDVNRMGLPAYQETDVLGVDLETSKRFTELATNKDRNEAQEEEYQALAQELSSNTMDLFGDDIPPVWYDASRLYIKTPFHDHAAAEAAGYTSEEIDFSRNRQITNRGFSSGGAYNNQIPSYVEGDSLDYSTFANPGDERNEGHGFFLDITGGDAPVGSYSMVWVSQPEWYEPPDQSFWEFVLNSPIVGIVASIISPMYGNMVVAGLKAASGMTLHASDWLSIGLGALKMSGQLQMPVDPEVANEMATTAAGDALTAAETAGQTLTELEKATLLLETYNSAYDIAITGFGIGTLSAAQTVSLMNVVAYEGDIGTALLGAFGDEYLVKSLSVAGIDISNLPDNVTGWMTEITTEMINGTSFDDAIKLTAGTEFLGYLQDSVEDSKVYATAKNILEEAVEEIDQATQAVQTMANDLGDGIDATISAIGDSMDTDLLAELRDASKNIRTSINSIGESIGNIATELNAEVLTPVTDAVKNNMSKFVTMAGLDNQNLFSLSGDSAADADSLMDDIKGFVGDTVFESVPNAIKDTLREAAIQKIALGEVDQNELKLMATRGSITIEAVSNLDGDLVDAIGPRILTKALQNTLTAATFGGDPGKAFLDTIADSTVQSIQTAMASGGWPQVVKKFDQFEDDITGKSREAQAAADEYNKIGTDFNALETRQKELDTEHNTAIEEIARLEGLALADGAGDEEMQAYLTYVENYAVRSQAIGEELAQIKTDKDALIAALPAAEEKYDTAVSAVNDESARLDPLLQKEFDNLYVNALVAVHPEIKMAEYATVSGMEWEGEYPTAEEIAEHFLSEGIQNGVPVNIEEYNARRDAGASQYVISALRASGIDATKLTADERKNITNYLLNEHATVKAEENGQTVVEYLEDFNETPDNFEAGEKALEAAYVLEEGFGTAPEAVALTVANRRANYAFNALGMSAEDVRNIANNEVSYTIDPVNGGIMWGGDGFMMREWNSTTKQFDTYQYDAGGGLKYKLNDDGSEPLVRILERTPMFNGIADLAEDSPASYMTFLATAPTDAAVTAQVNYLSQADRDADELQRIKDIQAAIKDAPEDDGRFAIPDSELPWIVRVARDWLDHSQEVENALLADVEYLENLEGPSIDDELRLEFARGAYAVAEGNTEFLATWVVKTPTKIASFMQTSINAFTAWSQGIAAEKKADGFRRQALYEGKSAEEADAIFREKYAEFKQDIDYSSIIHNDANQTHNLMESLARGVMPDSYLADQKEMSENIAAADGALDTVIAITGEIIDKPDVFLGTYIAEELPTAIFGLGLGSAAGRLTSLAAAKVVGKEAAESLATGSTVSMGASRVADLSEAFGETAYATYEEAKQELERIGYEGDIEAKAQEIAIKAGTTAMVLVGATAPFGAFALDNAILNASTKKAVKEVAQRVEGLGDTLTKETVTEVIQGGFTQGATEVFLYNAGVTDRDVAGNIAGSATLEGLVGGTTAGIITGLSTPTDTGTGFDGGDPFASLLFSNPDIKGAVEAGDATQVQALLGERNLTDTSLYVEVMNTVDDANYVTPTEVRQAFGYLGVQPTGDEVVALTNKEGITDATLEAEAEAYWAETYGEELLGTGRTTAQHYDIIQHMTDMINGVVPLDSSFNMNGDTTLDQADIDTYIAKLPLREQNLYNQYDPTDHEPTGIIEDLGGSLMTSAELLQLKQDIKTILDRGDPVTAQEVVDMLLLDPTNKALLKGQIEAAVGNEFAKIDNQNAFAGTVVDKLVENGTIKTQSKDAVKELFGDPTGNTVEEQGVFGVIEGLKAMLDLGESDAETLAAYISDEIGTAVELDEEGKIKDGTGSGLLGTLTRNGVLRDVAIAEISNVLGSAGDGTEANPATGLYAIANNAADTKAAVDRIEADYGTLDTEYTTLKNLYDTAITNLQTNLGSPDGNPDVVGNQPTGLYALVGKAITAGDNATGAVETILGDYVDFAAFETALGITIDGKIDEIEGLFGTPPAYQLNDDGTIKRDEDDVPLFVTEEIDGEIVEVGRPTGYHLAMYNAMQLQGIDRDLAIATLQNDLNQKITDLQDFTTNATAEKIKTEILDVYFPAKPDNFETGRALAAEEDYVRALITSGEYDASYDYNGDQEISVVEWRANRTPAQVKAQDAYNTWADNSTGITPALENLSIETGTNFALLNQRVDAVETNVTDYIRDNVLNLVGKPADGVNNASGIFLAIEEGDDAVLDVLGAVGEDGSGVLRSLELLGLSTSEIQTFLDTNIGKPAVSADEATADNPERPASGIFELFEQNTENYNSLVADYDTLAGDALTLAGEYQTLADSTANKIAAIDTTIGTLPTDEDGDGVFEGGSGLRLELFNQGLSIDEVNNVLGSVDDANSVIGRLAAIKSTADSAATKTALTTVDNELGALSTIVGVQDTDEEADGNQGSGLFGEIQSLASTTASNTEKYENLLSNYSDISGKYDTLAEEYQTLSTNTANKITAIDNTIGTLPTDEDGDGVFEGGSGLRLELFNQGLSIDEVNNVLGSVDDANSVIGRLAAIKSTADSAATKTALTTVDNELGALSTIVGVQDTDEEADGNQGSGLFGEIQSLASTTASNTEKYENLLSNYSDISGKYDTLAEEYQTLSTNTANKITAIDNTIGTLPTDEDGDGVFEGGSGLRLELFNQGLSIDEVNNVLGSVDDINSVIGRLAAIKSTADSAATKTALTTVDNELGALSTIVGVQDTDEEADGNQGSGLFGEIQSLASTTASNTEKYENLLSNYSDISGKYDTLAEEYQTLSTNTANKITAIDNTIGTLPTDEDGDGVFEGGSGLRLELFNQGLSIDEVNNVLGSVDDINSVIGRLAAIKSTADSAATKTALTTVDNELGALSTIVGVQDTDEEADGNQGSGLFGEIQSLASTTASNTEKYENLLSNYSDISGKYDTLAEEYQTLSTNTANKITAIDNTIGTLPTDEDGDGVFEGGSGLRLELFNQGLSIDEVNNVLGSVDDANSVIGRLAAIKSTADSAATKTALTTVDNELGALSTIVGVQDTDEEADGNQGSGLFGEIQSLASTTASNTEKYENLLSNYSDISGKYDTLAEEYQTLSTNTANKITAIDNTIGTLPTDEDGDGVFEGGSGLRLELFNQGLSIDEVNNVLGSVDDINSVIGRLAAIKSTADSAATKTALTTVDNELGALSTIVGVQDTDEEADGNQGSGLFGEIQSLASTTATNTAKYETLLTNYSDISGKYDTLVQETADLAGDFETLAGSTADKITAIDNTIGTLPEYNEGTEQFEGGSGLRLELFNQGLSIAQIEALLGSENDENSILGRLKTIKDTTDLAAKQANLTALEGIVGDAESGLVKTVNDIAQGIVDRESGYNALVEQVSGIAKDYDARFEEFDTALTDVATSAQVEDVQDTVDQIASFMGIPANEVTQQDMDAFAVVIADFEMDAEIVAQQDMLRYDVSGVDGTPDGQIDVYDQQVLQAGLEGDYSGFAPDAQFNEATGMFLERQQDQQRIAELEQERINQEAEFEAQRQADLEAQTVRDAQLRTDFQEDLDERKEEGEREEYLKAFTAPGRTSTTTTPDDPADIRYFYDIAGDDIFANQQQDEFYGAASPFGDNFMNEILTPPRRKAKGGLIDETDEILKILGE
jgi:hypothetical protein